MNPDDVYGMYGDEFGNDEMVGFSLGKLANLAFNPIAQTRAALSAARGAGGAMARAAGFGGRGPAGPALPPPPALQPGMAQAGATRPGNTIHAYMGLGAVVWTGADATLKTMSAEPQSSFLGKRLIIAQASTVAGRQVTITQPLTVSGMPQTPAPSQPAPIEMFSAQATYAALDLQIATSATQITIGFSISAAPGGTDTVNVSAGLYGEWIR